MTTDSLLDKTSRLREEAWDQLCASPAYHIFKALDDAVVAMGGGSQVPMAHQFPKGIRVGINGGISHSPITRALMEKRVSQGDAAEHALREFNTPMASASLLDRAREKGASVGGEKPLVSFTSSLSKDDRFYSFREGANYFWWLAGVPVPPGWNETANPNLPYEGAVSSTVSQKGGGGHDPTTT